MLTLPLCVSHQSLECCFYLSGYSMNTKDVLAWMKSNHQVLTERYISGLRCLLHRVFFCVCAWVVFCVCVRMEGGSRAPSFFVRQHLHFLFVFLLFFCMVCLLILMFYLVGLFALDWYNFLLFGLNCWLFACSMHLQVLSRLCAVLPILPHRSQPCHVRQVWVRPATLPHTQDRLWVCHEDTMHPRYLLLQSCGISNNWCIFSVMVK